jgi:cellulose synthase/poly-beta-1,6-N-acetylglucosamine synthase-like glycosyltransferase/peptidoglycan/xylan/chitin deacetylase (PgdA/CDA1 family)
MRHRDLKAPQDGQAIFRASAGRGKPLLVALLVTLMCAVGCGFVTVEAIHRPAYLPPYNTDVAAPRHIAEVMQRCVAPGKTVAKDWDGVPVIGAGEFLRVVAVAHRAATISDPFTHQVWRKLTDPERHATQNCPYAVEWFGQIPERTIAFTYDDGPHAVWTREIMAVLDANHVRATFFNIGENVVANPDVFRDVLAHGHIIGNHTLTHVIMGNVSDDEARDQILQTRRIFRAVGGFQSGLYRQPYAGNDVASVQHNVRGYLVAQQLGLVDAGFNVDPGDFKEYGNQDDANNIPIPKLTGHGTVIVMHDAGGKSREATVGLTREMIKQAKSLGYRFVTLDQLLPATGPVIRYMPPSMADIAAYRVQWGQQTVLTNLSQKYLAAATLMALIQTGIQALLALWVTWSWGRKVKRRERRVAPERRWPRKVSVLVAAFEEELTISGTVAKVLEYAPLCPFAVEVIVVNDGSKDNTRSVLDKLVTFWRDRDQTLRAAHIPNGGKGHALNYGILTPGMITGEVIALIDADTKIDEHTLPLMARHFSNSKVGAVTGRIRVMSQAKNLWQWMLAAFQQNDYNTGIGLARQAQFAINGVLIMSGACAMVRTDIVRAIGGFPLNTLGEDADLANMLRWYGYDIVVELGAKAYTEVPRTFRQLLKQHQRWWFGVYQVIWKHSRLPLQPGQVGVGLSMIQAVLALVTALIAIPLGWGISILAILNGNGGQVLFFLALFIGVRVLQSVIAMVTMREWNKDPFTALFYRFINDPLTVILAYRTLWAIVMGRIVAWNKVPRVGDITPLDLPDLDKALENEERELSAASS